MPPGRLMVPAAVNEKVEMQSSAHGACLPRVLATHAPSAVNLKFLSLSRKLVEELQIQNPH
jgi:hypothetical protein